jgi:hypothetical protein
LSVVARHAGPTRQRAAAAWPPCATPTAWFKALSGQRRAQQLPRTPCPPARPRLALVTASRPLARATDSSLTSATAAPTGRVRAPAIRAEPSPLPPPRRAHQSPSRRTAVSTPMSHRFPIISVRRCRAAAARCVCAESDFGPVAPG